MLFDSMMMFIPSHNVVVIKEVEKKLKVRCDIGGKLDIRGM